MKPVATLLTLTAFLTSVPVLADTDIAINVQQGYTSSLSATGTNEGVGYLNNGNTATGSDTVFGEYYPTVPGGDYGQVVSMYEDPTKTVDSVVFYDALWSDGGWFGVSGANGNGTNGTVTSTLSAAALAAPILQVTYSPYSDEPGLEAAVWQTLIAGTDYTDNYVTALTGATVGASPGTAPYANNGTAVQGVDYSAPTSVESTFLLTTPLTGVTGIRLVGSAGGTGDGTGFISSYEMEVLAPEPSTYAMLFGGMGMLVLVARLRRKLSV